MDHNSPYKYKYKPVQQEMDSTGTNNDNHTDVTVERPTMQVVEIEAGSNVPISDSSHNSLTNSPMKSQCSLCGQSFTSKYNLEQHYQGNHCDKNLAETGNMEFNQRVHTGEKPYKCSHCDQCFDQEGDVMKHQRTHTGEKSYQCSHCEKCFAEESDMIQHTVTHTGEKSNNDEASHCVTLDTSLGIVETHDQINIDINDEPPHFETLDTSQIMGDENNTQQDNIHITKIGKTDKNQTDFLKKTNNVPNALLNQDCCIFCLDEGDLIHMCKCSVLAHKECALEYIRFPGSRNDTCCQCREKLEYKVQDKDTPMKQKYVIGFTFLILVYLAMVGLSIFCTTLMIPSGGMNSFVYVAIVANLGIMWPLLLVFVVSFGFECCFGPRDRTNPNTCTDPGCYWSGGCEGCDECNCCDGGSGGDECGAILLVLCLLLAILLLLIAATGYLVMSLAKYYKSFALKSKKEIMFKYEGRPLNTIETPKSNPIFHRYNQKRAKGQSTNQRSSI